MCMFSICVSVCLCLHMIMSLFFTPSSLLLGLINVHHDTLMKRQSCGANRERDTAGFPVPHVSHSARKLCYSDHRLPRCHFGFEVLQVWWKAKIPVLSWSESIFGNVCNKHVQPVTLSWALILSVFRFISAVHLDPLPPFTCSYSAVIFFPPPPAAAALGEGWI